MSLESEGDRRKELGRRAREMAKAAKVVGQGVRQLALYDERDKGRRVEIAKLLAVNVERPGALGQLIAGMQIVNENGRRQSVVRDGQIKDALLKWTLEAPNLLEGWPWNEMAAAFGVEPTDKRLERLGRGITSACKKLGFVAERFNGAFKVMTVSEVATKHTRTLRNIEGQVKSRANKVKPLTARGYEPNGRRNVQMAWWDLLQLEAKENGGAV